MIFRDGQEYTVKLLREIFGHYDISYGKAGDVITLRHSDRYADEEGLCVVEGHGYGTCFKLGRDIDLVTDKKEGLPEK